MSAPSELDNWCSLFTLAGKCLNVSKQDSKNNQTLATKVNELIRLFLAGHALVTEAKKTTQSRKHWTLPEELGNRVATKIEAFDVRGAIRLAAYDRTMADP